MADGRTFVIGDIHGCEQTFRKLFFDILNIEKRDKVYLLGDYIDRGPRSKETVNFIMQLLEQGYSVYPIMGNHEKMFLDYYYIRNNSNLWLFNGAEHTILSFGLNSIRDIEKKYIDFFEQLPYYRELDNFIIAHAGLNFNIPDPLSDKEAMLWIRYEDVDIKKIGGKRLISGHTPIPLEIVKASLTKDKIYLDGGCVYKNRFPEMGYLCALEVNEMELFYLQNIDF